MKFKIYDFEGYSVEVVHNPADSLSQELQNDLIAECTEVSRESFGNLYIKKDFVRDCILNSSTVLFGRDYEGQLFGYSSNRIEAIDEYSVIYLKSMAIVKKYQGLGLRHLLHSIKMIEDSHKIQQLDIDLNRVLVAVRTQSPLIAKCAIRRLGLFPQPDGTIDQTIKRIGKRIFNGLHDTTQSPYRQSAFFDDQYFVDRGAYKSITQTSDQGVYPSGIPFCRDDHEINSYMMKNLNWQNGDALFLLGYYQDDMINRMFAEVCERMGFCRVQEVQFEEAVAMQL